MKLRVSHVTSYRYTDPVSLCHSIAHLKPRHLAHQTCLSSQVRVDPWPAVAREHTDFFGNRVSYFAVQQSHSHLDVTALSEVEVRPRSLPDPAVTAPWELALDRVQGGRDERHTAIRIFTLASPLVPLDPAATDYAGTSFTPGRPVLEAAIDLMGRIYREFEYDPHFSNIATPLAEVLQHRRGVCQDFAHLGLACLRGLGLPARYVSGYLETLPPPGQLKLQGSDASHAWFAIFIPDLGWVDFDPTNDQIPGEQHITTAVGRDYQDVTPLRGVFYGGGGHELSIAVDVNRVEPEDASAGPP
jgi:transglutaminase-like putative cysteine protease